MPQAAVQNFASLTALRILSGAAEAIADPGRSLSPMGERLSVAELQLSCCSQVCSTLEPNSLREYRFGTLSTVLVSLEVVSSVSSA